MQKAWKMRNTNQSMKNAKTRKTKKMKNREMHAHIKNYAADENIKTIKIEKL